MFFMSFFYKYIFWLLVVFIETQILILMKSLILVIIKITTVGQQITHLIPAYYSLLLLY